MLCYGGPQFNREALKLVPLSFQKLFGQGTDAIF
jgi:hypothetical protein